MPDSAFTATLEFATPAPEVQPPTFADAVAELNILAQVTIEGSATTYVVSQAEPGVDDRDKLWIKIAAPDDHLVGEFYFWQGFWRKTNTPRPYSIHMFSGDPAVYFDVDGKGIRGAEYDGFVLCDGRNGSIDLSDKFIVAAHMNNTAVVGYDAASGWRSTIAGGIDVSGGETSITLDAGNTFQAATPGLAVGTWKADGNTPNAGSGLLGVQHPEIPGDVVTILPATDEVSIDSTPPIDAIPIIPPFYSLAFVAWVGYEAY